VSSALSAQHPCDVLQPCQGEISALAQVLFDEVLIRCQVGRPVAAATLFGFLACGKVVALAHEGKGRDPIQPGKPFRTVRDNSQCLLAAGFVEFVGLCRR